MTSSPPLPSPLDLPPPPPAPPSPAHQQSLPATWHLASGAVSGAASVLVLQPLDLIKTRIQQEPQRSRPNPAVAPSAAMIGSHAPPKIWQTTKDVVRTDGVRGLWRGTGPTLYRNVPGVSMYFLTLSKLRTVVGNVAVFRADRGAGLVDSRIAPSPGGGGGGGRGGKVKLTTAGDLIVGSTARTGVGFLLMPFTLLKTISESSLTLPTSSTSRRPSTFSSLRTLYSTGGLKSLWRGAVPTALRDAPGAGLFIVFYERGRRLLGVSGDKGGGAVGGGAAGAAASLCSTLLTTPFDLVKTRRQLSPHLYTSLLASVSLVYRKNGLLGFWEGGGLRVVRKAGSAGIGWAVYEAFLGVGEKRRERERSERGE
ncbi:hypothetical protein JCM10212_003980 [Sporobolomyces blumeae]